MILVTGGSVIVSSTFIKINILGIFRLFWVDKRLFFANLDCEQKSYKQHIVRAWRRSFLNRKIAKYRDFKKKIDAIWSKVIR